MFTLLAPGVASAQVCSPPDCPASPPAALTPAASSPGVVTVTGKVKGAENSVLSRTDRSTSIPFLSVYAGLSILGFTLATIAVRRRAAPVSNPAPPEKRVRKPTDNTEWAAQILARRMERLEKTSPALIGSSEVAFGGHPHPPAGQSGGTDRA